MRTSSPRFGGKLPAAFTGEIENRVRFLLLIADNVEAMTTQEDIARLLNLSDLDGSAFAEVISDYFDDREAAHDSSLEEDDFLDAGMNSYTYKQEAGLIISIYMYHLRKRQYTHMIEFS